MLVEGIPSLTMEDVTNGTLEEKMLTILRDRLLMDARKGNYSGCITHAKWIRTKIGTSISEPGFMGKIRQADLIEHLAVLFRDCPRTTPTQVAFCIELIWCFSNLTVAENYEVGFVLNSTMGNVVLDELEKQLNKCTSLTILRHVECSDDLGVDRLVKYVRDQLEVQRRTRQERTAPACASSFKGCTEAGRSSERPPSKPWDPS